MKILKKIYLLFNSIRFLYKNLIITFDTYVTMNSKKLSLIVVLMAPLLLISSTITINQPIPQAFAKKIFSQGWNDGERDAIDEYLAGYTFNDTCGLSQQSEVSYCQGYKVGYRIGWTNAELFN